MRKPAYAPASPRVAPDTRVAFRSGATTKPFSICSICIGPAPGWAGGCAAAAMGASTISAHTSGVAFAE